MSGLAMIRGWMLLVIVVGTMIPSSPGYIGTFEVFGLMAMKLLGHDGPAVLGFVVTLHAISLLGSSVLGALSLAAIRKVAKHIPRSSELLQEDRRALGRTEEKHRIDARDVDALVEDVHREQTTQLARFQRCDARLTQMRRRIAVHDSRRQTAV